MSTTNRATTTKKPTPETTTTNTTSDDNGQKKEPYGFTDQKCIDTTTCMAPRECVWVGTTTCAESLNICSCKIPNNRQLCSSSEDCMQGDRCYQVGALLEQRCISCSLKGTIYVRGQGVRPVDNGWTCDLESLDEVSPAPSPDTFIVTTNPFNATNGHSVTSSASPFAVASPTAASNNNNSTSDKTILPGLIGGIAVAVTVPTVIIILICLKISYNQS